MTLKHKTWFIQATQKQMIFGLAMTNLLVFMSGLQYIMFHNIN